MNTDTENHKDFFGINYFKVITLVLTLICFVVFNHLNPISAQDASQKKTENRVGVYGLVQNLNGYNFDLITSNTTYSVNANSVNKIETSNYVVLAFSDIAEGDSVVVQGFQNEQNINAYRIISFTATSSKTIIPEVVEIMPTSTQATTTENSSTTEEVSDVSNIISDIIDVLLPDTTSEQGSSSSPTSTEQISTTTPEISTPEVSTTTEENLNSTSTPSSTSTDSEIVPDPVEETTPTEVPAETVPTPEPEPIPQEVTEDVPAEVPNETPTQELVQ